MKYLYLLVTCTLMFSCASKKTSPDSISDAAAKETSTVNMFIQYRKPYCGGARPTPEMEKGTLHPFAEKDFFITGAPANHDSIEVVTYFSTNKNGNATVSLPDGFYGVYQKRKNMSFEKFKKAEIKRYKGKELKLSDDKCLREFWSAPDGFFVVEGKEISETFELMQTCYSDFNFCMNYTGPYPP